jgi:small nuclear ribonucleoprotein G
MPQGSHAPELKKYLDKKLSVKMNGKRHVTGILRGFDQFMNITLDQATEDVNNEKHDIGIVVIRGNSIELIECLEPLEIKK